MKTASALLIGAGIWECIRFAGGITGLFGPEVLVPGAQAALVWFASPQLVLAAAFVLVGLYGHRYRGFLGLLLIGKLLSLAAGGAAVVPILLGSSGPADTIPSGVLLSGMLIMDLLVLGMLIILRNRYPSGAKEDA